MFKSIFIIILLTYVCIADGDEDCPNIVKRNQWSTVETKRVNYLVIPLPYIIIHHTVTPECETKSECINRVESMRSYHMDSLGWGDIGYSFLIGGDGNVYEGTGWNREGAHTYGYNKKSVGIAFIGNFQDKPASQKMLDTARKLINCGKSQGVLRDNVRILGGRQVVSMESPGLALYGQIQNWQEWVAHP